MVRKVIFAGLGAQFEHSSQALTRILGREADYLLDGNPAKIGQVVHGKVVSGIDDLSKNYAYCVYIFTREYESVCAALDASGLDCIYHYVLVEKNQFAISGLPEIPRFSNGTIPNSYSDVSSCELIGRTALVTGATRGVGRKIANELAILGCNLILQGRDDVLLDEVASECIKQGVSVERFSFDLQNHDALKKWLHEIENRQIDIVYNNAGISLENNQLYDVNVDDFMWTFLVNTIAPTTISLFLFEGMLKRGFGRIINVTTNINSNLWSIAYACSKAALDKLTMELALACLGRDVMVSSIDPGAVRTDMSRWQGRHGTESLIPGILLGLFAPEVNGKHLVAKDYSGLSLSNAIKKYKYIYSI